MNKQPTIHYMIEDEDALLSTTYVLTVSYTKCDGYPATWGYAGGSPGEPDHVEDVTVESVEVHICDAVVKGTPDMLESIRAMYEASEELIHACYESAFSDDDDCGYDDRDD